VGREVFAILLIVGCQILASGQMRGYGQDVFQGSAGGIQNEFDALQRVPSLLADVLTNFSRTRVSASLAGYKY
jgi:hypothetical protein